MEYVTGKREFQIEEPTVVTLGKFDGRHRGHQKLIAAMKKVGAEMATKRQFLHSALRPVLSSTVRLRKLLLPMRSGGPI